MDFPLGDLGRTGAWFLRLPHPKAYRLAARTVCEARGALVHMFVFGGVVTLQSLISAQSRCVWHEILPVLVGAGIPVPTAHGCGGRLAV